MLEIDLFISGKTDNGQRAVLRMKLSGTNPVPAVRGLEPLPGKSNYFMGNDPQKRHTDVPNYQKVKYREIYPEVDLVYYGNQRRLEYDFMVAPGANPSRIKLQFEGAHRLAWSDSNYLLHHVKISRHRWFYLDLNLGTYILLNYSQIISRLQVDPKLGAIVKIPSKSQRCFRRYPTVTIKNLGNTSRGYS